MKTKHRRSQGVQWVHLHPQGGKKLFRRNLQGKCVSAPQDTKCTPQPEQESILGHFLLDGLDLEVYLDRLFKKWSSTFLTKKVHPDEIVATPMKLSNTSLILFIGHFVR